MASGFARSEVWAAVCKVAVFDRIVLLAFTLLHKTWNVKMSLGLQRWLVS